MGAIAGGRAATALIGVIGMGRWLARLAELHQMAGGSVRVGRAVAQRHVVEAALERLRRGMPMGVVETMVGALAADLVALHAALDGPGRARLGEALAAGLEGEGTLVGIFHLARVAAQHRALGFEVGFAGFAEGAPYDLLISRGGAVAEIVCDVMSAEAGRDVQRGAWAKLIEAIDPDLQSWLATQPGRYLLKLTLNEGLRQETDSVATLQGRVRGLLAGRARADQDAAASLRLEPLALAVQGGTAQVGAGKSSEAGLMPSLRREFGHEAHLAVMTGSGGVCVLAARAGREDEIAGAIARRMAALAPARLSGTRPGILAVLVEDTDTLEWRHLRDQLEIEGAARQFLTDPAARHVVAVSCESRREMFDAAEGGGALRFRNPGHPAAKSTDLATAIVSSA